MSAVAAVERTCDRRAFHLTSADSRLFVLGGEEPPDIARRARSLRQHRRRLGSEARHGGRVTGALGSSRGKCDQRQNAASSLALPSPRILLLAHSPWRLGTKIKEQKRRRVLVAKVRGDEGESG